MCPDTPKLSGAGAEFVLRGVGVDLIGGDRLRCRKCRQIWSADLARKNYLRCGFW
jgi:hypothetical protein